MIQIQKMTCIQSKCKYPVTCDYNNDCMEQLVIEANNIRKMNYKEAIEVVMFLANKELEANQSNYDVPVLFKDDKSINIEAIEQAFDVIEEELETLPY